MHTKDGVFRQFAFIGFKDESTGEQAVKELNRTFIDTSKITVELYAENATSVKKQLEERKKDKTKKTKAISKSDQKDATIDTKQGKKKHDPFEQLKDDEEFQEFLKVQRNVGSKNRKLWSDDLVTGLEDDPDNESEADQDDEVPEQPTKCKSSQQAKEKVVPKEEFAFTVKLSGLPFKCKKSQVKAFLAPAKASSIRLPPKTKGIAFASFKTEAELKQAMIKHRSFLNGHRIQMRVHQSASGDDSKSTSNAKKDDSPKTYNLPDETIADSGRMFVRNLSYTCTVEDLEQLFAKFGQLTELYMPIDKNTKQPKGFAFVTFTFPEHAVKAFSELDKTPFQGRLLHLIPAHAKPDGHQMGLKTSDTSFKAEKEEKLKQNAEKSSNWNSLFVSADAVAEVLAEKMNVKKRKLVADANDQESIAVRMALAETRLVNETRNFLADNGVDLDKFEENSKKRSRTVILVKNLPAKTADAEINELFSKYGAVVKVILPQYGTTAIVEMQERAEAKVAFEKLAYSSFKHTPIYLEWAPANLLNKNCNKTNHAIGEEKKVAALPANDDQDTAAPQADDTASPAAIAPGCTLFVKNINHETTDDAFRDHFGKCGALVSAVIARRRADPERRSLGHGFVVYAKATGAKKALKQLHNVPLDGNCLQVTMSRAHTDSVKVYVMLCNVMQNASTIYSLPR